MRILKDNWFFLLVLLLSWLILPFSKDLSWNRDAIVQGQFWRLISGSLAHSNFQHFLMNMAGLFIICLIAKQLISQCQLVLISLLISLIGGFSLFLSSYQDYVGLSGLIHGLLALIAICELCFGIAKLGSIVLLGLSGKLLYEQIIGAEAWIEDTIGVEVAVDAHLYFAIIGGIITALFCVYRRYAKS